MKEGVFNGTKYNFNADPWELIGRKKTSLSRDTCIPPPKPTYPPPQSSTSSGTTRQGSTSGTVSSTSSNSRPSATSNPGLKDEESNGVKISPIEMLILVCYIVFL